MRKKVVEENELEGGFSEGREGGSCVGQPKGLGLENNVVFYFLNISETLLKNNCF